jgi:hypothetical protein
LGIGDFDRDIIVSKLAAIGCPVQNVIVQGHATGGGDETIG